MTSTPYTWVDGTDVSYSNWQNNEPISWRCVQMTNSNGLWGRQLCTNNGHTLCSKEPGTPSCYISDILHKYAIDANLIFFNNCTLKYFKAAFIHHADPTGLRDSWRVSMMHRCIGASCWPMSSFSNMHTHRVRHNTQRRYRCKYSAACTEGPFRRLCHILSLLFLLTDW